MVVATKLIVKAVEDKGDLTSVSWRKSSYSGCNDGNCVEVGDVPGTVGVRDSKDPDGPALLFTPTEWAAFTARVKAN